MSMNKANIDSDFLKYIEDKRNLNTHRFDRFHDDYWKYMMKALVNHGIDPNTMTVKKVDCKGIVFKDFAKSHDGMVIYEAEDFDDHGYHNRTGLLFVDTHRQVGNCYSYGFYRFGYSRTNTQNRLIKHFNSIDWCWFIERDYDTKTRLESIQTRRINEKKGMLVKGTYGCDKSGYKCDLDRIINTKHGIKIYNDRIKYIKDCCEKFSKLIMKNRHFENVNDMTNFIENICKIILNIEAEQYNRNKNDTIHTIAHQIRTFMYNKNIDAITSNIERFDNVSYYWCELYKIAKMFKQVNMLKLSIVVARKLDGYNHE